MAYSLRRVQALAGLSRAAVAGLVAQGFVAPQRGPGHAWRFSFQDLMLLRTARRLQAAQIPPRRIVQALERLRATLPPDRPLTALRITALGAQVAVRDAQGVFDAASGQRLFEFDAAPHLARACTVDLTRPAPAADADVRDRSRSDAHPAADASAQIDAALDLAATLCEQGRFEAVVALCDQALASAPMINGAYLLQPALHTALLAYNRALALDNLGRLPEALAGYAQCLVLDPSLADAHYNLARLFEQTGDLRSAVRHFNACRRLLKPPS